MISPAFTDPFTDQIGPLTNARPVIVRPRGRTKKPARLVTLDNNYNIHRLDTSPIRRSLLVWKYMELREPLAPAHGMHHAHPRLH